MNAVKGILVSRNQKPWQEILPGSVYFTVSEVTSLKLQVGVFLRVRF